MWVKDARVARLPGYKACKEGKRDRQPGPEDRRDRVGLGCELGGCGGKEGTEEIAEGLADFAEGDQADEKSGEASGIFNSSITWPPAAVKRSLKELCASAPGA